MSPLILLILAGLTALGFLVVVWRRRQMPAILRAILVIGASAIVVFVAWTISTLK